MTKEQESLKKEISLAVARLTQAHNKLRLLQNKCTHAWTRGSGDSVSCSVCGKDGGWYCPKSPDNCCEYDENDDCIYCGQPEERK